MLNRCKGALLGLAVGDAVGTTAAIAGQLAGAFYGMDGIPTEWLQNLAWRDTIKTVAEQLYINRVK